MKLKIILCMILLLFMSGCSDVFINTNPLKTDNSDLESVITQDFIDACKDNSFGDECFLIHKFGSNNAVSTTLVPVTSSGRYVTPRTAVTLNVSSDDAQDNSTGTGARSVEIIGLNGTWHRISQIVALDGLTPVTLPKQMTRVYRMRVNSSGTYANDTNPSHQSTISVTDAAGNVWAEVDEIATNFGAGQSLIAAYTIPQCYQGFLLSDLITVDSNKNANVFFFSRQYSNDTTSTYNGVMRLQNVYTGISQSTTFPHRSIEKYPPLTDIGFMASAGQLSTISAEFEMILVKIPGCST